MHIPHYNNNSNLSHLFIHTHTLTKKKHTSWALETQRMRFIDRFIIVCLVNGVWRRQCLMLDISMLTCHTVCMSMMMTEWWNVWVFKEWNEIFTHILQVLKFDLELARSSCFSGGVHANMHEYFSVCMWDGQGPGSERALACD